MSLLVSANSCGRGRGRGRLSPRRAAWLLSFACVLAASPAQAWTPGKDGALTINANTNYSALAAVRITSLSAAAAAGATTITLASTTGITSGDVLMIYQAQGATIATTNDTAYGTISALNSAGRHELVSVLSVAGSTVTLGTFCDPTPLQFSYLSGTQVIRVPQYSSLTINAGVTLSAPAWTGTSGGVMPLIVQNTLQVDGDLSAAGAGFRGGVLENVSTASGTSVPLFRGAATADGAEKGESIAGFQADYTNGSFGRGAPANGGGGGNSHNGGGGGGANGDSGITWTGLGNPDTSVAGWITAWEQEGAGVSTSTSSGGGRGGYTFGSSNQDALTLPPGGAAWGGNRRRQHGGLGGRPLANDPAAGATTRLFLGGGGGAGDANNNSGSSGARGGGLVYVIAGTVAGGGRILADGSTAANSNNSNNDAPGGGGGGGTILVAATTASGIATFARGGNGGSQLIINNESEGPGGGGGGGFIARPAALAATVTGGVNGTTTSAAMTEFLPNGATRGAGGAAAAAPALSALPVCTIPATITLGVTKANALTEFTPGGTATYTIVVTNSGNTIATGTAVDDTLPDGVTLTGAWTCTASAGGTCPVNGGAIGGSAINLTGDVAPNNGTLTITVPVAYSANPIDY